MIDPTAPDYTNTPASPRRAAYPYLPASPTEPPVVAVVTPVYNVAADVFDETARSIRQQSLQQWEWLIINDGSNLGQTLDCLNQYRETDPRIRVIDHPFNQGPGAARNSGFRAARADFVVVLDNDDLLEPTAIEKWLWFLYTRPHMSFTQGYSVRFGHEPHLWSRSFEQGKGFLLKNQMDITAMIRRDVWETAGGFDESLREGLEDWDFWLRCAARGYWGAAVPEYLNWYRLRPAHTTRWPAWHQGAKMLEVRAQFEQRYPELYRGQFPNPVPGPNLSPTRLATRLPCPNLLEKSSQSQRVVLLLSEQMVETEDQGLQSLLRELDSASYQLSICLLEPLKNFHLARLSRFTPDVYVLPNFLEPGDYPRFLRYLIASRQIDLIVTAGSRLACRLLPFLHTTFSDRVFASCLFEGEKQIERAIVAENLRYQEFLDLVITNRPRIQNWLVENGAKQEKILCVPADYSFTKAASSPAGRLKQLHRAGGRPGRPAVGAELGQLHTQLALEAIQLQAQGQSSTQPENVTDLLGTVSGEELGWLVPARKLIKAFGFKLAARPGFRWLYRFRYLGKRLLGKS